MKLYHSRDRWIVGILLLVVAVAGVYNHLQNRPDRHERLCQQVSKPTVKVNVHFEGNVRGHGTGIIIARYERIHFVLTCNHVTCSGAILSEVECPDGKTFIAHVVHNDPDKELSVLYFIADSEYPVAKIAKEVVPLTSELYLYGYGEQWPALFTKGIFSGKQSLWEVQPNLWVAEIHVWPGYSGGGIYNEDGELYGVASMMMVSYRLHERLPWLCGFVPLPDIQEFLQDAGLRSK